MGAYFAPSRVQRQARAAAAMSNMTFDTLWREAMTDLMDLMEMETVDAEAKKILLDPANPPKELPPAEEDARVEEEFQNLASKYIRYMTIYKKLEDCYDQMIHPQKREDIKVALENC